MSIRLRYLHMPAHTHTHAHHTHTQTCKILGFCKLTSELDNFYFFSISFRTQKHKLNLEAKFCQRLVIHVNFYLSEALLEYVYLYYFH